MRKNILNWEIAELKAVGSCECWGNTLPLLFPRHSTVALDEEVSI